MKILKETLGFLLIEPAVPGALEEFTFSGFKSVFLSAENLNALSSIYSFAIGFILLIKYSF